VTTAANAPSPQSSSSDRSTENGRIPLTSAALKRGFLDHLYFTMGKYPAVANQHDLYMALSYTIRDRMMERWINTVQNYRQKDGRVVCYLSVEFLLGKHLANNLNALGIREQTSQAVAELGYAKIEMRLVHIFEMRDGKISRELVCDMGRPVR
jgi:starch phosphorylase